MEILPLLMSLAFTALTFILLRRRSSSSANLPPGSFGWPIVGETMEFLFGKPEKFVADRMKKYSTDIFKTKILGEKTVVICGPDGHKFLFSNEQKYFTVFRPHATQHIFRSYKAAAPPSPPVTDEVKTIRQPGFLKPEALMRFLPKMDSISQKQIDAYFAGNDVVQVFPLSKAITLSIACQFFMGIDKSDRIIRLVDHFDDITAGMFCLMVDIPGTIFHRANRAAAAIRKELIAIIREKKEAMKSSGQLKDVLAHMIVATDPSGKSMPEAEIADKIMGLLTAGYSTVSTTMTFFMKYVGLNPEIYEKVRREQMEVAESKKAGEMLEWEDMGRMKYTWNVICETMRMVPPLQGTFREAITDFTYAGYTVPKGWKVYWTVSTTGMNSKYFKNPEKFNPSRYEEGEAPAPYTYVPFGAGPRMCPGKEYARVAILAFVHNVVKSYKWELMDPDEKVLGDMIPTPQNGLPVRLHRT